MVRQILLGCLCATLMVPLRAQDLPILKPTLSAAPDLSPERKRMEAWYDSVFLGLLPLDNERKDLYDSLILVWGELLETPCDVIDGGCSWYCGGGPDSVWASSTLAKSGEKKYDAQQAHDLDYCAVWSEGVAGNGVGQWLAYRFAPDSPRLHTVIVSNGLVQNAKAWKNNNRVKRILVSANGTPVVELGLEDSRDDQAFRLPRLLGRRSDGKSMILTFTILEVYPGDRYQDTVLSEIWFDGTDVH